MLLWLTVNSVNAYFHILLWLTVSSSGAYFAHTAKKYTRTCANTRFFIRKLWPHPVIYERPLMASITSLILKDYKGTKKYERLSTLCMNINYLS